ncbi:MAG: glycine--tRNA ligase [Planctomycetota bacterium]
MSTATEVMEKIVALCRRRGFIFGSSEIYGGIGGFWDYGPLGCELKRNIKEAWWKDMVQTPPTGPGGREFQMVGVDCSIIMNPKVWEASGHATGFADPMVDCKKCKARFRADQVWVVTWANAESIAKPSAERDDTNRPLAEAFRAVEEDRESIQDIRLVREPFSTIEYEMRKAAAPLEKTVIASSSAEAIELAQLSAREQKLLVKPMVFAVNSRVDPEFSPFLPIKCPACKEENCLTEPRSFNLMFQTHVGALEDAASLAYLRPETAQGIFANFKNVMDSTRVKIPFGIAQMGKAFRNEINPRNYTFRSREFEQMEIEFFCHPNESMQWYEFWRDLRIRWYESLNIRSERLRPRQQDEKELAHYSRACTDIEYLFPFSDEPQELEGVAHRGSFDLNQHGKFSRNDENAFAVIDDSKEKYVPHVIEPSAGVDRFALATICEAYTYDESRASPEFLKFHPRLAPIKAAVFPLVAKDGMPEIAEPIYREIRKHYTCQYDAKQSIGKRYARMDEAGTPFCFTIDGQSKEDGTVTVRNRDDASQIRIDKSRCVEYLRDQLKI